MAATVPATFRECHRLRKYLRDLGDEIERGPRVLAIQQKKLADEEAAHKSAYDTIKKLKLEQKTHETSLKTIEQHLDKLSTRAMQVTTMKEMEATKSEIDQATVKKNTLEDQILGAIMEIEERTNNLPNVETQWAEAQKEFSAYQVEAKERLERMLSEQKISQETLALQDALLPEAVKIVYLRLVKSYGANCLAEVRGLVCQQCRAKVTEHQRTSIERGEFITCSSCGRGLYVAS